MVNRNSKGESTESTNPIKTSTVQEIDASLTFKTWEYGTGGRTSISPHFRVG